VMWIGWDGRREDGVLEGFEDGCTDGVVEG